MFIIFYHWRQFVSKKSCTACCSMSILTLYSVQLQRLSGFQTMRSKLFVKCILLTAFVIASLWIFAVNNSLLKAENRDPSCLIERRILKGTLLKPSRRRNISAQLLAFGSVCHQPQCFAIYESSVFNNSNRIPAIRHILWKGENVSAYFAMQLKTWYKIHPNWRYVLWRDSDLEKFVAKHYSNFLGKFNAIKVKIARIDMIRYMILHHFGGVYADLDYVLVKPLDRFLKFPAIVTRETEAHAIFQFGMSTYPPPVLGNPAFMMSEPGHPFYHFSVLNLACRDPTHFYNFAGPRGLSDLLTMYSNEFPLADSPDGIVIVPASRSFYGFDANSLAGSQSKYKGVIIAQLQDLCLDVTANSQPVAKELAVYCRDVYNLDPITDRNEPVYAIHDYNKSQSSYDATSTSVFTDNNVHIRSVIPNIVMSDTIF